MNLELINYLVRESNKDGFRGMKIIGWVPGDRATQDERGTFIYEAGYKGLNATESED